MEKESKTGLTVSEIYHKLGLEDPFKYALHRVARNLDWKARRHHLPHVHLNECINQAIGRTTYMLVHALVEVSRDNRVIITAGSMSAGRTMQLHHMARGMARALELNENLILSRDQGVNDEVVRFDEGKWSPYRL